VNGCTAQSTPFNITVVGINILQSNITFIYPNPAKDELTINSQNKYTSYTIYNLLGSVMLSNSYSSKIDIKQLPQGVYIIALKGENGVVQKMWVKD
jgi:phage-related protein